MKMKDVDQTDPHTNEAFGQSFHGPWPVTDGGYENTQTMEDVDHESPVEGVARTYRRG